MKVQNKGFTLIELVIAIFILTVAIIGVYNSFSTVVISTAGAFSRFTAVYLAQEGIEIVRNMRDNNWLEVEEDWRSGLLNCEEGCEADYKTGTSKDIRFGLTAFSDNCLKMKNDDATAKNGFYSYDEIGDFSPTKFKRKIIIVPQDKNVLRVSVLVTWKVKKEEGCKFGYCIEAEEYLYNWYQF